MKGIKEQSRLATSSPKRSVSIQIRDYQVTAKVKSAVPRPSPAAVRSLVR